MITFVTHVRVSPENAAAYEALLTDVTAKIRANEPGVVYYGFAKSTEDPQTYVTIEVYRDQAAIDAHTQMDYFKDAVPKTAPLVEGGEFNFKQYVSV